MGVAVGWRGWWPGERVGGGLGAAHRGGRVESLTRGKHTVVAGERRRGDGLFSVERFPGSAATLIIRVRGLLHEGEGGDENEEMIIYRGEECWHLS